MILYIGMVTNSRSVGGFKGIVGKEIIFDDGEFEVTLIKTPKNPIELNEVVVALSFESSRLIQIICIPLKPEHSEVRIDRRDSVDAGWRIRWIP